MYRILGGDGKEYGPITTETLRQWIAEGRANAETQVRPEGASEWQALGSLPEFSSATTPASAGPQFGAPAIPEREVALRAAKPAGWALTVVGILGIVWNVIQIILFAVRGVEGNPILQNYLANNPSTSEAMQTGFKIGLVAAFAFGIAWAGFIVFAGAKLRRLESWGLVLTAAILALIPCFGSSVPVCFLSFPVGVWVIVVLSMKKSAFN